MSRPMVLVFLFVILIITSQFEWKQQLVSEMDSSPNVSQKQQNVRNKEEAVKEKIILLQEKKIQQLEELLQTVQEQLLQCQRVNNAAENYTVASLSTIIDGSERQHIPEKS